MLDIQAIRTRAASNDMRKARAARGGIIITETHAGNLSLDYDAATKTYTVANINTGTQLASGDAKSTRLFLAAQYVVRVLDENMTFAIESVTEVDGGDIGDYWLRCYENGQYAGGTRYKPSVAWETIQRLMAEGWIWADDVTRRFVQGQQHVDRAFAMDAATAHLYDERGRLKSEL